MRTSRLRELWVLLIKANLLLELLSLNTCLFLQRLSFLRALEVIRTCRTSSGRYALYSVFSARTRQRNVYSTQGRRTCLLLTLGQLLIQLGFLCYCGRSPRVFKQAFSYKAEKKQKHQRCERAPDNKRTCETHMGRWRRGEKREGEEKETMRARQMLTAARAQWNACLEWRNEV